MRGTRLYTDAVWPVSGDGVMHGCSSCPAAKGIVGKFDGEVKPLLAPLSKAA